MASRYLKEINLSIEGLVWLLCPRPASGSLLLDLLVFRVSEISLVLSSGPFRVIQHIGGLCEVFQLEEEYNLK